MEPAPKNKLAAVNFAYFFVAVMLVAGEVLSNKTLVTIFKPLLIPTLAFLYFITSEKQNRYYFFSLILAVASNIILLSKDPIYVFYGVMAFLFYRLLTIYMVYKFTTKFHPFAFIIAIVPFLFMFIYLIDMTEDTLSTGLYPAIANALVMSVLAALSLSNYVFEDDRRNSWLLISSILFVVLMFIFVIERFYLENPVFRPMSVMIFAGAHYAFYRYVLLCEDERPEDKQEI